MHFLSEVYWNKGGRKVNQDTVSLQEVWLGRQRVLLGLVCDGIGGLWRGEMASGFAAEYMTEWFHKEALTLLEKRKRKSVIVRAGLRALYNCNREMKEYGEEKKVRFGTTLTMLLIYNKTYILWHSGDSRAYRIYGGRRKKMQCLTEDHTAGGNVLTKCMGSFRWQPPDIRMGRLKRNQTFLICSDGFRRRIDKERLKEALAPGELKNNAQLTKRLAEIAEYTIRQGEKDNLSAVLIKTE